MHVKILIVAALALGLGAGGALAKSGPPQKDDSHGQSAEQHGNGNSGNGNGNANGHSSTTTSDTSTSDSQGHGKTTAPGQQPTKTRPATSTANKAASDAKKDAKFRRETKRLGYNCRGGTTHIVGKVVTVTPATATTPGSMTILVTSGNSRGKSLVGQQVTIELLQSTEVIARGHSTQSAITVGSTLKIDARSCTGPAVGGVTPPPSLLARKVSK